MHALDEPSTIGPWSNQGPIRLRGKLPPAAKPIDGYERWTNIAIGVLLAIDVVLIVVMAVWLAKVTR